MKKVFVGLSGGVDSAVSAALLKEQGFDVVGVFIKIWQPEFTECTWARDRLDAMRVCVALGIPFREIDLSREYKQEVVKRMINEYSLGITPNPDVLCNGRIKFGSFLKFAERKGADWIATGHYARIAQVKSQKPKAKSLELLRGKDRGKDQSYFLYLLNQDDLARTLFPVGGLEKREVRELARKFNLPVAEKSDSQGLCFVGEVSMKDFLSRFIQLKKGAVLNIEGAVIGVHDGAPLYTIGQRHGFSVKQKNGNREPYYVAKIDARANTITVTTRLEDAMRTSATLNDVHWISESPSLPAEAMTQSRYRETPIKSSIVKNGERIIVSFSEPHIASPGQSLVIYDGDRCLGGGIIQNKKHEILNPNL